MGPGQFFEKPLTHKDINHSQRRMHFRSPVLNLILDFEPKRMHRRFNNFTSHLLLHQGHRFSPPSVSSEGLQLESFVHFDNMGYTHTPKSLQCLRLTAIPNQNARHDPCPGTDLAKPLSPLETLALTSLDQTIMVLFVFDRIPSERRFPTGLFSWALLTPTNKNAKQALFLVCILQDGF